MSLNDLYTPRHRIPSEFLRRRSARAANCSNSLEELLLSRPHAVILRNVLTPNFETFRFVAIASAMGLNPLVLEFHADKYVGVNPAKAPLGLMRFSSAGGVKAEEPLAVRVIDPNRSNGRPFHSIQTLGGGPLTEFHHELLPQTSLHHKVSHHDASSWVAMQGGRAASYYQSVFRLFISHAVLFESYLNKGRDKIFTETVVLPAFNAVTNQMGLKPLICRLDPPETEGCESWYHYPASLYPFVARQASQWALAGNHVVLPKESSHPCSLSAH